MAYDPLEALQTAGVLVGDMPEEVKKAIGTLSQKDVEVIISQKSKLSANAGPWVTPSGMMPSGTVTPMCACGLWSGSGGGAAPE